MNKIKSISKRVLAVILATLMLLTSGIVGTLAANVDLAETGANITVTLDENGKWSGKSGYILAWAWASGGSGIWHKCTSLGNNQYSFTIDSTRTNILFVKATKNVSTSNWNDAGTIQYQTGNLTIPSNTKTFQLTSTGGGSWIIPKVVGGNSDISLRGAFNSWSDTANIMTYEDSTFNTVVTTVNNLSSGSTQLKLVVNGNWTGKDGTYTFNTTTNTSLSLSNVGSGNDVTLNVGETGNYVFTYNISANKLSVKKLVNNVTATFSYWKDGITVTEEVEVAEGNVPKAPIPPTRVDYDFAGWSTDPNATTGSETVSAISKDTTFYAIYTLKKFTVTFDSNGGTSVASQSIAYGSKISAPSNPTKAATAQYTYTFSHWEINGTKVDLNTYTVTGAVTLKAVYTETLNKYTITFVNGDGTTTTLNDVEYGSDVSLQAPEPAKVVGQSFSFWDSNVSGSTLTKITGATTFTAKYTDNKYSVTVNSADGGYATAVPNADVTHGGEVTLTATVTDEAYGFTSWTIVGDYDLVSGYTLDTAVTKIKVNGPITVTPVFTAKDPHTLTINITGDTGKVKVDNKSYTGVINTYKNKVHSIDVDSNTNYYIKSLKVDGVDVPADKYSYVWHATFTVEITADTVIDVVYSYNPTVGADLDVAGGKVTVEDAKRDVTNSALPVTYKADVPYEITAPKDYYVNKVTIDGNDVFTASANEFKSVYNDTIPTITTNKTIVVDFEKTPTGTLTITADTSKGSVSPAVGSHEHYINTVVNLTATPNSGYAVEWYVDGVKKATGATYSYTVEKTSCTIEARFVEQMWSSVLYLEDARSNKNWNDYYAYIWNSDNVLLLGAWPGGKMEKIGDNGNNPIYAVYVPVTAEEIESYNLIFTCNSGDAEKQTATITFQKSKNYYVLKTQGKDNNGQYYSTGEWQYSDLDSGIVASKILYGINGSVISAVEKNTSGYSATYRGTTTFPEQDSVTSDVDTSNPYYAKVSIAEEQSVDIITTVISDDFVVDGWVINGTKFVKATPTGTAKEFRGTIPAEYLDEYANDAVAVYSHSTSWFTAHPGIETVQVFADISKIADSSIYKWGEYITAYTWTQDYAAGSGYQQFGEWVGQLMIPVGDDQPGVYYTNVEKIGIDGKPVKGITFTNFGGNAPANTGVGFIQTYDYYEFITLQEKDNIIYVLQPTDTSVNLTDIDIYTSTSSSNNITVKGLNAPLVNYGNEIIDIYRDVLTEEEVAAGEIGLYVVRTGPNDANTTTNSASLDGEYYIDCYVYDANKKYIGKCKSYELLDLEKLATTNTAFAKLVNNKSDYEGKIVQVFYEAPNTTNNTRVDGEWYGTDGTETVTLTTRVALKTDSGYQVADSNTATYGTATIGGAGIWSGPQGTQDLKSAITTDSNHKFIGWHHGILDDNGNVVVDTSKPIVSIYTDYIFTAYNNSYYVAVFEELASGSFTVNNFSYEGSTTNASAPPVYNKIGRDASFRYVKIDKVDSNYNVIEAGTKSDTYFATADVQEGDILKITIYTTPKYTTDYVYAWYMEALEDDGTLNFEEVGTEELAQFGAGEEATFSFYYVITDDYQKNMIIYSDIVTKTADITLDYRYYNRYGSEKSYTKVYTLLGEELQKNRPSDDTIAAYAPFVNDLYKDVTWKIKNCVADSTGTRFVLEAVYDEEISVNISVNGESCATISGEFNESYSLYATDYDPNVTNKGFWYIELDEEGDGEYTDGVDAILSYGTYYGLVFTRDMDINYVEQDKLDFKVVLNSPVYGREQSVGGIDKVYTDFIINYLVPYFSGNVINGEEVFDLENRNAPIRLEVYAEAADVTIEYGMVHQMINTMSDDSALNEANKENYFNNAALSAEEIEALEEFLNSGKTKGMSSYGNGQLYNYKYTGNNEDLTNKNRALMTFYTNNTANNRNKYYSVVAYLAITDNTTNETVYYFSNVECFNINEFVNKDTNDLIDRN